MLVVLKIKLTEGHFPSSNMGDYLCNFPADNDIPYDKKLKSKDRASNEETDSANHYKLIIK